MGKVSRSEDALLRRLPMKMTTSTRLVRGVTIVDLSGRIVLGEGGGTGLRDLVRNLAKEGIKKILLNLRNVDFVDSSGLGELVSACTSMRSQGGELKLLNLTKRVHALLQITKLLTVFDITDDEATSVSSFSPAI
jgi:anti-sigma B factor antagonist